MENEPKRRGHGITDDPLSLLCILLSVSVCFSISVSSSAFGVPGLAPLNSRSNVGARNKLSQDQPLTIDGRLVDRAPHFPPQARAQHRE